MGKVPEVHGYFRNSSASLMFELLSLVNSWDDFTKGLGIDLNE
ncbi:hypothetical protein M7I_3193 [Glarea lozoyensis 74030]|uniref:Uncharacterized protein n=1 Tax=Glarea lozoyensis (strain ATCC 74030 / MF5533) TaxID=1104152 RepID=H0EKW0_GLAL7|nr:hypothetical protein M7I_3193 [Glarea lozoyensis 74030]